MDKQNIMKDMKLNDMVSVTLPAHVWLGFIAAYGSTKWKSEDASEIHNAAMRELVSPLHIKEMEAERQLRQSVLNAALTGQSPVIPPHMGASE